MKGRSAGAETVIVARNEILSAINKPDDFYLAAVHIDDVEQAPRYLQRPFRNEPDIAAESLIYNLRVLFGSRDGA